MNRTEIADQLRRRHPELCHKTAMRYVQDVFDIMAEGLLAREQVKLRGIGMLVVQTLASRDARDPRTGTAIHVGPRDTLRFRTTKSFRERLDETS